MLEGIGSRYKGCLIFILCATLSWWSLNLFTYWWWKSVFWLTEILHEPIVDKFIKFIDEQADIIMNVSTEYTTQSVESLNTTYGRVAPKKLIAKEFEERLHLV